MIKSQIRSFLLSEPDWYDFFRKFYRVFKPKPDPVYLFFDKFSKSHKGQVTFLQIGANDGLRNDPIREFIVRDKWRGVFVEPLPDVFVLLKENYSHLVDSNLKFVNAAISPESSNLTVWRYSDEFLGLCSNEERMEYLRKSSFDKDHVAKSLKDKHRDKFIDKGNDEIDILDSIKVPCLTLPALLEQFWPSMELDVLVVDAEGHDASIIMNSNLEKIRPAAVFFEVENLGADKEKLFNFFADINYEITELGADAVALRK